MAQLQAQIGALLLGMFRPIEEVGIYKIAASVGGLVVVGLTVVNVVVAPYLADLHAQRDIGRLRRLARRASLLSLIAAFPVALLLIAAGGPLLEIGFGPDYRAAYLPLAILAGGQLINGATGGVNLLLAMTGNERDSLRSVGTALGASAILSVLLIPSYGAVGAAVGSAAAMVISNGLSAFYVNRWLRQPSGGSVVV
jgi:O-antigen/teichoic acid export membrane protein